MLLAALFFQNANSQTNKELALSKGKEAIKLMDEGKLDESIKLLKEAKKLDSEKFDYPYELAYAHYLKKDFHEAINILETITDHKNVQTQLYQLLGNSYDIIGKSEKALEVYNAGLKKFPNAGSLYLEQGNVYLEKNQPENALPFYEKGIEADPKYPSNYYRATQIYCNSTEELWGMMYGEIFINLERNSKRTSEISQLLFETYKNEIKFTSETTAEVSFSQNVIMAVDDNPKEIKLPFSLIYEPTLLLAVTSEKAIDLNSLDRIRTNFLQNYKQFGHHKTHPNVLFDYQYKLLENGNLEAYNYWLLSQGDFDNFDKWRNANKDKWDKFVDWYTKNPIKIDNNNKFVRY